MSASVYFDKAIECLKLSVDILQKDQRYFDLVISLDELSDTYRLASKPELAQKVLRDMLSLQQQKLKSDKLAIARTEFNLASVCIGRRQYREAADLMQRSYNAKVLVLGSNHPEVKIAKDKLSRLEQLTMVDKHEYPR